MKSIVKNKNKQRVFTAILILLVSTFLLFSCSDDSTGPSNSSPAKPSNPFPANNADSVSTDVNLSWSCSDPNGDTLTYDVYLGNDIEPDLVSEGLIDTTFIPGSLEYENTYYWKIKAHDDHSNSTTGDVWQFTTTSGGGTGTVTDIDGNVYQTVKIGDQWWMAENLKVTHYRNGDPIPNLTDDDDWTSTSSGAYCYYDNDASNADTYGALYNWYAVDDSRGLAPDGWHVPTDDEIKELEMYLGMGQSQADYTGDRGTNEGSKFAGGYDLWDNGNLRNDPEFDASGFSFLPGGYRSINNVSFNYMGYYVGFWSSTELGSYIAWIRTLLYDQTTVYRNYFSKRPGLSVRCVRD